MIDIKETYRDNDIFEMSYNNKRHIILAIDEGYEPFLDIKERICDEFKLEIINEYGLTDMYASFIFHGSSLELEYFSMDEMITLITDATDEILLNEFREMARELARPWKKRTN